MSGISWNGNLVGGSLFGIVYFLGLSIAGGSLHLLLQASASTGDCSSCMAPPVISQTRSEDICTFNKLVLLFNPGRKNFLSLNHFVQDIFGGIDEWIISSGVSFDLLASGNIL